LSAELELSKNIASAFSQFVATLPEENKLLLEAVTRFLYMLTRPPSQVELDSIAAIFGPILCPDTPENSIETCVLIERTFKLLIENCERIRWDSTPSNN